MDSDGGVLANHDLADIWLVQVPDELRLREEAHIKSSCAPPRASRIACWSLRQQLRCFWHIKARLFAPRILCKKQTLLFDRTNVWPHRLGLLLVALHKVDPPRPPCGGPLRGTFPMSDTLHSNPFYNRLDATPCLRCFTHNLEKQSPVVFAAYLAKMSCREHAVCSALSPQR